MTTDSKDSNDLREREWRLQEQARLDQKRGAPADGTARALRYRQLARELDQPLDATLPSNFSHAQVMRIEAIAAERRRADRRFERRLRWGFVGGYGVFMLAGALVYRDDIVGWLDSPVIDGLVSNPWVPALLGCVVFAYVLRIRPRRWFSSSK
jgi:hypothetical protein